MKKKDCLYASLPFVFSLLLSLISVTACQQKKQSFSLPPVEVTTLKIVLQTLPAIFEYVGFVESSHSVEIRARVEGYLNKVAYKEGDFVNEGDLLFEIDPLPFQALVDNAKGELKRQEAILWEAHRTVERFRPLFEKKAASQRDLDSAISQELASEASVESAKAQLKSAELNLSYTSIFSPISGLATLSNFLQGSLITPGSNGLLTTISILDPIWVKFNVTSNELLKYNNQVKLNQLKFPEHNNFEVELILADNSVFPYRGKVDFASPTIDPRTGTMISRATISNPESLGGSQLKPGEFVRIKVYGAERPNAVLVPQKAVQQGQEGMYVLVVNSKSTVEMRSVEPGEWYQDNWIIKSGLQAGEDVIIDGVNKVVAGQKVIAKPLAKQA
jgi:membrane fusion protein, multidrug efflux system